MTPRTLPVSFTTSHQDHVIIVAIAQRAEVMAERFGVEYGILDATMDITATHANGCPLDLAALLATDEVDFGHDVFGIRRHIDRVTGELGDCFLPRSARRPS